MYITANSGFCKNRAFFVEKTPKIVQNLKKSAYMYISMKSSAPDLFIPVVYSDTRQTPDFWRFFKKKTFDVIEFSIFGVFFYRKYVIACHIQ